MDAIGWTSGATDSRDAFHDSRLDGLRNRVWGRQRRKMADSEEEYYAARLLEVSEFSLRCHKLECSDNQWNSVKIKLAISAEHRGFLEVLRKIGLLLTTHFET